MRTTLACGSEKRGAGKQELQQLTQSGLQEPYMYILRALQTSCLDNMRAL